MAITGVHAILYTNDAAADRAFFADVLGLPSVDAGDGWLIFALPPAELAAHPASTDGDGYDLYLMGDNIDATIRELTAKGGQFRGGVTQQPWGLITSLQLPGGGRLGFYAPRPARRGRGGAAAAYRTPATPARCSRRAETPRSASFRAHSGNGPGFAEVEVK